MILKAFILVLFHPLKVVLSLQTTVKPIQFGTLPGTTVILIFPFKPILKTFILTLPPEVFFFITDVSHVV